MVTGSKELIRDINSHLVLEAVLNEGPISRAAMAAKLGLTKATISAIVLELMEKQLLLSEYPFGGGGRGFQFPQRNRIISGLSEALVVVEAGLESGSLITANLALEQGKEVFALLGNNSPQNEGSNKRIKEGSAIPMPSFLARSSKVLRTFSP